MQAIEHDAEIESVTTEADEKAADQIRNKKNSRSVSALHKVQLGATR
jgi:hypothetical protein